MPPDSANGIEDPFDPATLPDDLPADPTTVGPPEEGLSESLTEELAALIDDTRTYAEAELAFQKTRASLAGKNAGIALGLVVVAVVVLHVAVLALAVGLVMALAPLVTIWGSIAIVVGALLALTGLLGWMAMKRGKRISAIFAKDEPAAAAGEE
ncbi:MAG: phage holin family protein [Erythrobacter sp.]|nr:MAG: phage holin family protein [Erythrobacter sp.]